MQKWEYCCLRFRDYGDSDATLEYFTMEGLKVETAISKRLRDMDWWNALAKVVAQLGEEGWAMVTATRQSTSRPTEPVLYFKRPKP